MYLYAGKRPETTTTRHDRRSYQPTTSAPAQRNRTDEVYSDVEALACCSRTPSPATPATDSRAHAPGFPLPMIAVIAPMRIPSQLEPLFFPPALTHGRVAGKLDWLQLTRGPCVSGVHERFRNAIEHWTARRSPLRLSRRSRRKLLPHKALSSLWPSSPPAIHRAHNLVLNLYNPRHAPEARSTSAATMLRTLTFILLTRLAATSPISSNVGEEFSAIENIPRFA